MMSPAVPAYAESGAVLDRWILAQRPARNAVDASLPYAFFTEQERSQSGELVSVAAVFLTNRECPWRCLMCDLWQNTLPHSVPVGAIPAQIAHALAQLPPARHIKLYNSGSFFDVQAIPPADYAAIAERLTGFERVIVESHPLLVGPRILPFRKLLSGQLEVAMGLETVHPQALARLNKRMTLDDFAKASAYLRSREIALRAFVLVQPPFVFPDDSLQWAERSIDFAFDCGATAVCLIPTRGGNGAMERMQENGLFSAPQLRTVEAALDYGIHLGRGRVFVDLWNSDRIIACPACRAARLERLAQMNLSQGIAPHAGCGLCGESA